MMIRWTALALCCLSITMSIACGGSAGREVIGPRHIASSSSAPDITRVLDLGDFAAVPARGTAVVAKSDASFVIGEMMLIEGDDFGKLPTVAVGGKPAKRLGRTRNGGILVRVPAEVDAGKVNVEVSHSEGSDNYEIEVRRYLAVGTGEGTRLVSVAHDGSLSAANAIAGDAPVDLEFSYDGQALYVLTAESLAVLAVAAQEDMVRARQAIPPLATGLVSRVGVPSLAVLHKEGVNLYDTGVSVAISLQSKVSLEQAPLAGAFSPDGQFLAVLTGNSLHVIGIAEGEVLGTVKLKLGESVSLLHDLAFSPAGDQVWVLSGNTAESLTSGVRKSEIHVVQWQDKVLAEQRSAAIGLAVAPLTLAVSQREAVMAASTVRSTRQRALTVLTSVSLDVFSEAPKLEALRGQILRFDLDGNATVLVEGAAVFSDMRLSHRQDFVLAATRRVDSGRRVLGVTSVAAKGGASEFLQVAPDVATSLLQTIPLSIAP